MLDAPATVIIAGGILSSAVSLAAEGCFIITIYPKIALVSIGKIKKIKLFLRPKPLDKQGKLWYNEDRGIVEFVRTRRVENMKM